MLQLSFFPGLGSSNGALQGLQLHPNRRGFGRIRELAPARDLRVRYSGSGGAAAEAGRWRLANHQCGAPTTDDQMIKRAL